MAERRAWFDADYQDHSTSTRQLPLRRGRSSMIFGPDRRIAFTALFCPAPGGCLAHREAWIRCGSAQMARLRAGRRQVDDKPNGSIARAGDRNTSIYINSSLMAFMTFSRPFEVPIA
jgi:hypothetical protein